MSSDLISRLSVAKTGADKAGQDRANYAAYVADRVADGGWSSDDVAEYKAEVGRIMTSGDDEEKSAAREFWAHKVAQKPEAGINQRIRASIAVEKREAA